MKKLVLRLDLHDDKGKQKAMKSVSGLPGIDSIAMDMKKRELTVVGDVDPIVVVSKLRKLWPGTDIVSVGPEKVPEKKKDDGKKDEAKKDDDKKKDDGKPKDPNEQLAEYIKAYHKVYNPYMATQYYHLHSAEENPNSCVIC